MVYFYRANSFKMNLNENQKIYLEQLLEQAKEKTGRIQSLTRDISSHLNVLEQHAPTRVLERGVSKPPETRPTNGSENVHESSSTSFMSEAAEALLRPRFDLAALRATSAYRHARKHKSHAATKTETFEDTDNDDDESSDSDSDRKKEKKRKIPLKKRTKNLELKQHYNLREIHTAPTSFSPSTAAPQHLHAPRELLDRSRASSSRGAHIQGGKSFSNTKRASSKSKPKTKKRK